jgi:hypothetical protein
MLFLDLHLANVAGVLDDLGNVRLMSSPDLTGDTFGQVRESTVHPVLPKDTDTIAERRKIRLDHTERSVNRPENEEDDEEVVHVPEAFEVCATGLFRCCDGNGHQRY